MPGLASAHVPVIDLRSIAPIAVVSARSLPRDTIDGLYSQYGDLDELMITRSESLPPGVADYLGGLTLALGDEFETIKCHVYRSHKNIRHLDVFLTENASLGKRDRSQILFSLKE